ncbi:hypothetical protein Mapa_012812 [Marchantia paleacea]|nr:hypothetical protein Mapa_012812 [Marchantia paleacea]
MSGKKSSLEVTSDNRTTQGTSSTPGRSEMAIMKTRAAGFDIVKYDGRGDYLLWESQVKRQVKVRFGQWMLN